MHAMFLPEVPGASTRVQVPSREAMLRLMGWYVLQSPPLPPRKTVGGKRYCSDPSGRDIILFPEDIVRAACGDCKKLSMLEARWAIDEGARTVDLCMTDSDSQEEHVFVRVDGQKRDPAYTAGMPPRGPDNFICVRIWPPENAPSLVRRAQGGVSDSFSHGPVHRRAAGPGATPMNMAYDVFLLDRNGIPHHKDRVMTTKRAQGADYSGQIVSMLRPGHTGVTNEQADIYTLAGGGTSLGSFLPNTGVTFIAGGGGQRAKPGGGLDYWVQVKADDPHQSYSVTGWMPNSSITWENVFAAPAASKPRYRPNSTVTVGGVQYRVAADGSTLMPIVGGSSGSSVGSSRRATRVQRNPDGSERTFYSDGSSAITKTATSTSAVSVGRPTHHAIAGVTTTEGGRMIWSGQGWVPNPSFQGAPVYTANSLSPGYQGPAYPTMPVQPVYVTNPPPVQLVPSQGIACEVQIVNQSAYRVCPGQQPTLLGQYIGNNQVVLNGNCYNIDPATGGMQFEGPYTGAVATLPVAQYGAPDALSAVQNAAGLLSGVSDVLAQLTAPQVPGGLVQDPGSGLMYDPSTGLVQDPSTGQMVDPSQLGGGGDPGGSPDDMQMY